MNPPQFGVGFAYSELKARLCLAYPEFCITHLLTPIVIGVLLDRVNLQSFAVSKQGICYKNAPVAEKLIAKHLQLIKH